MTGSRTAKRRQLLSWLPTAIVAAICVAMVVGAIAMNNSWWTQSAPPASKEQETVDRMSIFTPAGVEYLTRQGRMKIKLRASSPSVAQLGLEPLESRTIEPLVPVEAIVLGEESVFHIDLVREFTVTASTEQVASIALVEDTNGTWQTAYALLSARASDWGWSDSDLEALQRSLLAASRESADRSYGAGLPAAENDGNLVSARIDVDGADGRVTLSYTIALADAGPSSPTE